MNRNLGCTPLARFLRVAAACALALTASVAAAQPYPNRTIRVLVGFPAGTGPDVAARIVAQQLQDAMKSAVVVENKPGAAGFIAAQEAARAAPDGYTLLFGEVGQLSMASSTYKSVPYDAAKDFAPISQVVSADFALVVSANAPPKSFKEYVDWAKAQQGLLHGHVRRGYARTLRRGDARRRAQAQGRAGALQIDGRRRHGHHQRRRAGHVRHRGARDAARQGRKAARGRRDGAGAIAAPADVPTFKELGQPDLQFSAWFGLVAPAKTPPDVINKLNAELTKALASGEGRKKLEDAGFRVARRRLPNSAKYIADERERWAKVVKTSGFKALD